MLPVTPCSQGRADSEPAQTFGGENVDRRQSPRRFLVLREGIEPTRPPGPTVLQTVAIPFCHLSTFEICALFNCQTTKKERIRSELKAQKRPLLLVSFKLTLGDFGSGNPLPLGQL